MNDSTLAWLDRHTIKAPPILRARVRLHAEAVARSGDETPAALARASRAALHAVSSEPSGGRSIALDLLAADALITLALLAQSQAAPDGLEQFATSLLTQPVGAT